MEGKEACRRAFAGFTSGGEQITQRAMSLGFWEIRRGTGGRQDSTERIHVGVAEKQFVVHLGTLRQKVFRRVTGPALGVKRSAPYRSMGATRDVASLWIGYGARPAVGELRRLMRAKTPGARARQCEQWGQESRVGVNQYPSQNTESRALDSSPLITIRERHLGECL